MQETEIDSR